MDVITCIIFQSNFEEFSVIMLQSFETHLCAMLNIRLAIHQQTDDLVPTLEAGQGQGRVAVSLDLRVDVTAHVEQEFDGCSVPVHGCQHL